MEYYAHLTNSNTHTHTHACRHARTHARIHTHTLMYIYIYIYIYIYKKEKNTRLHENADIENRCLIRMQNLTRPSKDKTKTEFLIFCVKVSGESEKKRRNIKVAW